MTRTTTRGDALRRVISALDDRRDGILPMHLAGVSEHFDATSLIGALQLRWYAHLSGLVERELATRPLDQAEAVATAWARAAATHPGVRAALDAAAAHPENAEMAANQRHAAATEHAMLGAMASLAQAGSREAIEAGAAIVRHARTLPAEPVRSRRATPELRHPEPGTRREALRERVRHLVA